MALRSIETVRQFSSKHAGQRVGWVSVEAKEKDDGRIDGEITVMTATVDENGAKLFHEKFNDGYKDFLFPSQEGFLAVAGLTACLSNHAPHHFSHSYVFGSDGPQGYKSKDLMDGKFGYNPKSDKVWSGSRAVLVKNLKSQMRQNGLNDQYPMMYYLLNSTLGRDYLRAQAGTPAVNSVPLDNLLLIDSRMHETTSEQVQFSASIVDALTQSKRIEEEFKASLYVFAGKRASEIPDNFIELRRNLFQLQQKIGESAAKMTVDFLVHSDVGCGSRSFSWPYLGSNTEDGNPMGPVVLDQLRQGDAEKPIGWINYELKEFDRRIEYANDGLTRLREIERLEQQ